MASAGGSGAGRLLRSQSAQSGPPSRPSNLPPLRRPSSSTAASGAGAGGKPRRRAPVLTPFDYPVTNPVIGSDSAVRHEDHDYYMRHCATIKQEGRGGADSKGHSIHSAPLYSVHALPENRGTAQSASATPTPQQRPQHFSLSTALLQIPQHPRPSGAACSFNFLWWYPETKFCELDPLAV